MLYNALGNQTRIIEADNIVTAYSYDPLYRLNSVTLNYRIPAISNHETNVTTNYNYDHVGNMTQMIDANGNSTTFSFDGMNRLVREVDAEHNQWDYGYDPVGNRTWRVDANRNLTKYGYYDDNQLKLIDYDDSTSVAFEYDQNNNRTAMRDHLGKSSWSFDPLNRITDVTDALGRHLGYGYDPVSNRTSLTYADDLTVNYRYFKNNWLKEVYDPQGNLTSYERDGVGLMTHTTNPNGTVADAAYDKANRMLSIENRQVQGNDIISRFDYTYNDVGHVTQMQATYGWRNPRSVTSDYSYDPLRRLTRDADSQGIWTNYTFDAVGNRLTLTTNDDSESPRPFDSKTLNYSYNKINQIQTIIGDTHPGQGSVKRSDNVAQALHAFRHEVSAQRGKHINEATADDLLTKVDGLIADLYSQQPPRQNAISDALTSLRDAVNQARSNGTIDSDGIANSLLVKLDKADGANNGSSGDLQTTTFDYDANGNRINKHFPGPQGPQVQGTDYRYDRENRLIEALDYQGNNQGNRVDRAVTRPDYDGIGRRLIKEYDPKTGNGGAKRIEYVFDNLDPIAEYDMWNPQRENFYRGDMNRIIEMQHFPSGTAGQMFWYHYDALGSVTGLTKQQGQSTHNYRYEPYGQIEMPPGNFSDPHNHYTFTGQELDENTGLYDFFARNYDFSTGTWIQQDIYRGEIRDPRTLHRLGYVTNNPTSYVDAYGYFLNLVTGAIGAVTGAVVGGAISAATQYVTTGKVDWKEVGASAIGGAVTGAICGVTVGVACAVGGGAAGGAATQIARDMLNGRSVEWNKVAEEATIGAVTGLVTLGAGKAIVAVGNKLQFGSTRIGSILRFDELSKQSSVNGYQNHHILPTALAKRLSGYTDDWSKTALAQKTFSGRTQYGAMSNSLHGMITHKYSGNVLDLASFYRSIGYKDWEKIVIREAWKLGFDKNQLILYLSKHSNIENVLASKLLSYLMKNPYLTQEELMNLNMDCIE